MIGFEITEKRSWYDVKITSQGTTIETDITRDEMSDIVKEIMVILSLDEIKDLLEEYHGKEDVRLKFAEGNE